MLVSKTVFPFCIPRRVFSTTSRYDMIKFSYHRVDDGNRIEIESDRTNCSRERIKNYARVAEHDRTSAAYPLMNRRPTFQSYRRAHTCEKSLLSDTATGKPDYCAYICAHADMFPFVIHATGTKRLRFSYRATRETLYLRFDLVQKKNLEIFSSFFPLFYIYILVAAARFIGIRDSYFV